MRKSLIKSSLVHEIIVEKSRFIAYVTPICDENDFLEFKRFVHQDASGARHYPYAYVIDNSARASDDGEPSGTAGRPLLELIGNLNLVNIAIIVVRYYGGVKLGAGRLLRTYVEAANQALAKIDKYIQIDSALYRLIVRAADLGRVEYLFVQDQIEIIDKEYRGESVVVTINAPLSIDVEQKFNLDLEYIKSSKIYRKEEQDG